jgi:hypothetical protein
MFLCGDEINALDATHQAIEMTVPGRMNKDSLVQLLELRINVSAVVA